MRRQLPPFALLGRRHRVQANGWAALGQRQHEPRPLVGSKWLPDQVYFVSARSKTSQHALVLTDVRRRTNREEDAQTLAVSAEERLALTMLEKQPLLLVSEIFVDSASPRGGAARERPQERPNHARPRGNGQGCRGRTRSDRFKSVNDLCRRSNVNTARPDKSLNEPCTAIRVGIGPGNDLSDVARMIVERSARAEQRIRTAEQVMKMHGSFLIVVELGQQHREYGPTHDRRFDHGARVDPHYGGGVVHRIEIVGLGSGIHWNIARGRPADNVIEPGQINLRHRLRV